MPLSSLFKKKKGTALDSLLSMGSDGSQQTTANRVNGIITGLLSESDGKVSNPVSNAMSNPVSKNVANGDMTGIGSSNSSMNSSIGSTANLWSISVCHSHRNVKPCHQMLLAESMFDERLPVVFICRLMKTMHQIMSDNNVLPYFVQFMESQGSVSKNLIRFCIQTECLTQSQKSIDWINESTVKCNDYRKQFVSDSLSIYNRYLSLSSPHAINISIDIKNEIESRLIRNKSEINYDLFKRAQDFVISQIENVYYEPFLRSTYFFKYQIDILTSGTVFLADVLFNNTRLASNFMEFMEIEGMKSYVDFLLIYQNYKISSNHYEDAQSIFRRFFSLDSPNCLGFSDAIRTYVSERLNGNLSDCFDRVAAILVQYLEKTYLRQFLDSEFYFEYLSYCISSIQIDSSARRHKRTNSDSSYNSDCSFVSSLGTKDGDSASNASPSKCKLNSSHIGIEQTPDSLWKRDLSGKLQITHIDKYGRILSRLQPEPDHNSSSLSKMMRKWTRNDESDKTKEEMAWQVARMVVDDVHKMNQSAPP